MARNERESTKRPPVLEDQPLGDPSDPRGSPSPLPSPSPSPRRGRRRIVLTVSALNALIGAWLVAAAFWLDAGLTAAANDVVVGLCVLVLGLLGAIAGDDRGRWRW